MYFQNQSVSTYICTKYNICVFLRIFSSTSKFAERHLAIFRIINKFDYREGYLHKKSPRKFPKKVENVLAIKVGDCCVLHFRFATQIPQYCGSPKHNR